MFCATADSPDGEPRVCWLEVETREKRGTQASMRTIQMTITAL
jgi:hypothetical protein